MGTEGRPDRPGCCTVRRRRILGSVDHTHDRYEELAVGHVLGGLPDADATEFRTHLLDCRDCRLRVAELHGIAADLVAVERDERAVARVRTDARRQAAESAAPPTATDDGATGRRRTATVLGLVVLALTGGFVGFWNLHLRTQVTVLEQTAAQHERTIDQLASGVRVATRMTGSARGQVVVDGERVTFAIRDLPPPADNERLVVWLLGTSDGDVPALVLARRDGLVFGTVADRDATALVITAEVIDPDALATPRGPQLVRADLRDGLP